VYIKSTSAFAYTLIDGAALRVHNLVLSDHDASVG
jgi:hypothetical protein